MDRKMDNTFDKFHYGDLMEAKQYDDAINYVDEFRALDPGSSQLRYFAALARGAKGEHILESFDRMQLIPPNEKQEEMIQIFKEAIEIDPALADPYWDLAVLYARFQHDAELASYYLKQARKLGYRHPMMNELEATIVRLEAEVGLQ